MLLAPTRPSSVDLNKMSDAVDALDDEHSDAAVVFVNARPDGMGPHYKTQVSMLTVKALSGMIRELVKDKSSNDDIRVRASALAAFALVNAQPSALATEEGSGTPPPLLDLPMTYLAPDTIMDVEASLEDPEDPASTTLDRLLSLEGALHAASSREDRVCAEGGTSMRAYPVRWVAVVPTATDVPSAPRHQTTAPPSVGAQSAASQQRQAARDCPCCR